MQNFNLISLKLCLLSPKNPGTWDMIIIILSKELKFIILTKYYLFYQPIYLQLTDPAFIDFTYISAQRGFIT